MWDLLIRFLVGGVVVSIFAVIGDMLKPKTFAGLFGAAPSVALATLGLTAHKDGAHYASVEARSMMIGASAFAIYAFVLAIVMMRRRPSALTASISLLGLWLLLAIAMWWFVLG